MLQMIYCCGCKEKLPARLTTGAEVYPHREDLASLPFWRCDVCKNYVGCHHKTGNPTRPLGCIPTREIRTARSKLHALIDPIWKNGHMRRKELYIKISAMTQRDFHSSYIRSVEEARDIYRIVLDIKKGLDLQ